MTRQIDRKSKINVCDDICRVERNEYACGKARKYRDGLDISFEECNVKVGDTIRHHFESESGTEERERTVHGVRTSARHQQ